MRSSLAEVDDRDPRTRYESVRPRMAKVELPDRTIYEKRAEYGAVLKRASELAGMNRDQTADALGVKDPSQITRWWKGEENQQVWRYYHDPKLRPALRLAEAESAADCEVEHVIKIRRNG